MLDSAAYRANETNAKRAIADWRLSNINDPYVFQNQGFPVRADSFLDLAQIVDTMQEGRFDYYMKELGGFTDEETAYFVKVCLNYIDFYSSFFQRKRVVVPLSTLISHYVIYRKILGFNPQFRRLLELGPGCGYLSFFLRDHEPLEDYTQIESTESFYLLQSHINSHVFGSRFGEHALSRYALGDHGAYVPKLNWHNPFHYEQQKIIDVEIQPKCNHYPWWRIGEVARRRYDLVTSNANLNEFSREALFQYLSLVRDVLTDDGAIVAQCLGGGPPSYDTIFAHMKSAGFVPVALIAGGANMDGRLFVVANGVFVGERHALYSRFSNVRPTFPILDRSMDFVNKMYFLNEERAGDKNVRTAREILQAIVRQVAPAMPRSTHAVSTRGSDVDRGDATDSDGLLDITSPARTAERIAASAPLRDTNKLRKVAQLQNSESGASVAAENPVALEFPPDREEDWVPRAALVAELESLRRDLAAFQMSRSWRITGPFRSATAWVRRQFPSLLRFVRRFRGIAR